jgi:TRAP transporter 4TM/12TM fusion protein
MIEQGSRECEAPAPHSLPLVLMAIFLPVIAMIYALNIPSFFGWIFYTEQYLILFISFCCVFIFTSGLNKSHLFINGRFDRWLRILCGLLAAVSGIYSTINYESILFSIGFVTTDKVLLSSVGIFLLLEALRRVSGYVLVMLCCAFVVGPMLLAWISDGDWVRPIAFDRLLTIVYFGQGGIHGIPAQVAATVVAVFVVFGQCLILTGGGESIQILARRMIGGSGGADKLAVAASAMFGSLSGSASANVATTGVMTIPLMISQGIPPYRAAAIEAVASTGGLILPPIMAATGFLIAEYLMISYAEVASAALVPALLFYGSVFVYCHFSNRTVVASEIPSESSSNDSIVKVLVPFILPIVALIVFLFVFYQSASVSALAAASVALMVGVWNGKARSLKIWAKALLQATPQITEIAVICGAAGIIMGVLSLSGIGANLSRIILTMADGSLPILIAISALSCIVLGMGVPVTATYVILIGLVAPALIEFGVSQLSAHLFVFYFGTLSFLTPPVCLSVFVAANLARSGITETAVEAMKIAAPAYLLPIIFIYQPALIGEGGWLQSTIVIGIVAVGLALLSYGMVSSSPSALLKSTSGAYAKRLMFLGSGALCLLMAIQV